MSFRVFGAAQLFKAINKAVEAAQGPKEYFVGSAVVYGPFHEFGSARVSARPHWQPAIGAVALKYGLAAPAQQNQFVNAMIEAPEGLVKLIAFDLERHVKLSITAQHIIDTGNYRGSIATGKTESEAFGNSVSKAIK